MASSTEYPPVSGNDAPVHDEITITDLVVSGVLPEALSGQYLRTGPNPIGARGRPAVRTAAEGMVHAITLPAGGAVSYRNRWTRTDAASRKLGVEPVPGLKAAGRDSSATNLIAYAGTVLSLGDGALAFQLTKDLETLRRVDLAGGGRAIGAYPKADPATGELHLLSSPGDTSCAYHVISSGGLTRRSRAITAAPLPLRDLAITQDRLVLVGEGLVGVTDRYGDGRITWLPVATTTTDHVVSAYDDAEAVVIHVVGQTPRRLRIDVSARRVTCGTLDPAPQRFGRMNERRALSDHRFLYTVAAGLATSVHKHDLVAGTRESHDFGAGQHPGEFLFVEDPDRADIEDGGWLLGLVHDLAADRTSLVVLDAARVTVPALAAVMIPRRVPFGLHGLWVPIGR
jgi:carotenoid cleavage dioxygenase